MTKTEAREAKTTLLGVTGYEFRGDDGYPGIIVQVGYHESGNERLVAVEGRYGVRWFDQIQVKAG